MDTFLNEFSQRITKQSFNSIHINRGGCGRAAVEFYKYFRLLGKYEVLGLKVLTDMQTKVSPRKKDKQTCLSHYFSHVVLAIKHEGVVYYVDAGYGIIPQKLYSKMTVFKRLKPMTGYLSLKLLQKYINRPGVWNTTFNVQKINKIRKFLREDSNNERSIRNRSLSACTQRTS